MLRASENHRTLAKKSQVEEFKPRGNRLVVTKTSFGIPNDAVMAQIPVYIDCTIPFIYNKFKLINGHNCGDPQIIVFNVLTLPFWRLCTTHF